MKYTNTSLNKLLTGLFIALFHLPFATWGQEFSLLLIGDAGENTSPGAAITLLDSTMKTLGNSGVIFLGDNIYPRGLVKMNTVKRPDAELRLMSQLQVADHFSGQFYMIPGNHDWRSGRWLGWKQVKAEEAFVKGYFSKPGTTIKNAGTCFLPSGGLPGPSSLLLDSTLHIRLIVYDLQWWLQQQFFHKVPLAGDLSKKEMNAAFFDSLKLHLKSAAIHKETVIIAAHHPLLTIGQHAKFNEPLHFITTWIPPFQIAWLMGLNRLFRQDVTSKKYRRFADSMLQIIGQYQNIIYANGHDHNLQCFSDEKNNLFITSGAGSKTTSFDKKAQGNPVWKDDGDTGFFQLQFDAGGLKSIVAFRSQQKSGTEIWKRKQE